MVINGDGSTVVRRQQPLEGHTYFISSLYDYETRSEANHQKFPSHSFKTQKKAFVLERGC